MKNSGWNLYSPREDKISNDHRAEHRGLFIHFRSPLNIGNTQKKKGRGKKTRKPQTRTPKGILGSLFSITTSFSSTLKALFDFPPITVSIVRQRSDKGGQKLRFDECPARISCLLPARPLSRRLTIDHNGPVPPKNDTVISVSLNPTECRAYPRDTVNFLSATLEPAPR